MRIDRKGWLLLTAGITILAGFAHTPLDIYELMARLPVRMTAYHIVLTTLFLIALLAAYVPFVLSLVHFLTGKLFGFRLGLSVAVSAFVIGSILTLLSAFLAGAGTEIALLQGATLTAGIAGTVLWTTGEQPSTWLTSSARTLVAASVLAACWSLASAPAILTQAHVIASDRPFCLAHHGTGPVTSIADLRGFRFYTDKSGYKSTSRWFFHGTMTVRTPDEDRYYNWSPRRFSFELIERPTLLHERVDNDCDPDINNWQFSRLF